MTEGQAACKHERVDDDFLIGSWSFCKHCNKEWTLEMSEEVSKSAPLKPHQELGVKSMKYYMYSDPAGDSNHPVHTIMSEKAVLAERFADWNHRVQTIPGRLDDVLKYKPDYMNITEYLQQRCIEDWIICNWAVEVTPEVLLSIIQAPNPDNFAS